MGEGEGRGLSLSLSGGLGWKSLRLGQLVVDEYVVHHSQSSGQDLYSNTTPSRLGLPLSLRERAAWLLSSSTPATPPGPRFALPHSTTLDQLALVLYCSIVQHSSPLQQLPLGSVALASSKGEHTLSALSALHLSVGGGGEYSTTVY